MTSQTPAQEPTMEEILASIRRIISEDSGTGDVKSPSGAATAEAPPSPAYAHDNDAMEPETAQESFAEDEVAEAEDQILELTEALPDEPPSSVSPVHTPDAAEKDPETGLVDESELLLDENADMMGDENDPVVHFEPAPLEDDVIDFADPEPVKQDIDSDEKISPVDKGAEAEPEAGTYADDQPEPVAYETHADVSEPVGEEPDTAETDYEDDQPEPVAPVAPVVHETHADDTVETIDDIDFEEPVMSAPTFSPDPSAQVSPQEAPPLLSSEAENAASAAFGDLTNSLMQAQGGGKTLEEIVTEMLRPMLKDWLDDNLPPLVENLVRSEIERISRRTR